MKTVTAPSGVEANMSNRVPSFFLLVPGPWTDASKVVAALQSHGIEAQLRDDTAIESDQIRVELVEDGRLADGFSWGRYGPLPDELVQQVGTCSHAALLELGFRVDQAHDRVATIGRALRDAGGVAVRMEASGSAWVWEPWLERLDTGLPGAIYETAVIAVQWDDGVLFTCGMHHFDLPDAQVEMDDPSEAIAWLDAFNIWQLAESPVLLSGQTFRPDAESERRVVERWPDHRHHPNDGRHNPFGLWRFLAPGQKGIQPGELVPVIIPSVVAMLGAMENKNGRPLTRVEVEELVDKAPAIAMEPADAITMERSRGYADIEPELAWEQWQLVRTTM